MCVVHILRAYSRLDGQPGVSRSSSQLTSKAVSAEIAQLLLPESQDKAGVNSNQNWD